MLHIHVSQCAYDSIIYNLTSFTINVTDIVNQLTCTVRYIAVGHSSTIYLEEPFVAFHDLKKTQTTRNNRPTEKIANNIHEGIQLLLIIYYITITIFYLLLMALAGTRLRPFGFVQRSAAMLALFLHLARKPGEFS